MRNNSSLLGAAARTLITTDLSGGGELLDQQVADFYDIPNTKTVLMQRVSKMAVYASEGEKDVRLFGERSRRLVVTEAVDGGHRSQPTLSKVSWAVKKTYDAWETSKDVFLYNIEQEGWAASEFAGRARVWQQDEEDCMINGDTTSADDFLKINQGILALCAAGCNDVDASALAGAGDFDEAVLYAAAKAIPTKYEGGDYMWIMSRRQKLNLWEQLTLRAGDLSDSLLEGKKTKPLGYELLEVPRWSTTQVFLCDPEVFIFFYKYIMKYASTDQGKDAVTRDVVVSVMFGWTDYNILDKASIVRVHTLNA